MAVSPHVGVEISSVLTEMERREHKGLKSDSCEASGRDLQISHHHT